MPIRLIVPKESVAGEKRVALVPAVAQRLIKQGLSIVMEKGAGDAARYPDASYQDVEIYTDDSLYNEAGLILKVQPPTLEEVEKMAEGSTLVGYLSPYSNDEVIKALQAKKITSFAMELIPRITRAQSMDALSSQASASGYKAVILAAGISSRFFPMLTTAAGTIKPSKVLIIGAGVAGLQAIATARRLGAVVEAYDVRSATREEVESLGAKFVDTGVHADGSGGYARELTDEEKAQQQEVLEKHIIAADVVITTAAIPGRSSPRIISKEVVEQMKPGAVIVDLAAEGGGNCELTKPGKQSVRKGVTIYGPLNVPSMMAIDTSESYAKNLMNFIALIAKEDVIEFDWEDQILADSVVTHDGEIKNAAVRERIEGEAE